MSQKQFAAGSQRREDLIVRLKEAQQEHGYVSQQVMTGLAESLQLPLNEVYGVASFYSFLSVKPLGRNVIRVCQSLPCYLKHNRAIIDSLTRELGIPPGGTTPDGRFSLLLTNCIGLCDMAPAMLINDDAHGDLTPRKIAGILKSYK